VDHQQFDRLARAFAHGVNRRSVIRGTLGILGNAVAVAVGRQQALPAQVVSAAADPTCSPTNSPTITCEQINAYVAKCGVTCANGTVKEQHGGCTYVPPIATAGGQYTIRTRSKQRSGQPAEQCARATVNLQWVPQGEPQVTMLKLTPPTNACCQDACDKEYERALKELATHEAGHVTNWTDAVAKANQTWTNRTVEVCKSTTIAAQLAFAPHLQELVEETALAISAAAAFEPVQAVPITCDLCQPAGPGRACCKDTCVSCPDGSLPDPETCQCPCAPQPAGLQDSNSLFSQEPALCCPENSVVCKDQCCDGACTDRGECCPAPRTSCGNSCCVEGQSCCESTLTCGPAADPCNSPCVYPNPIIPPNHHCPTPDNPYWCCPPECSCCPGVELCLCHPDQICCGPGKHQCYDNACCITGVENCAGNADIGGYCCPDGAGFNKDTLSCCAVGETSVFCTNGPEACCPIDNPNWCECCGNCE
jgi:hypothetical protein